MSSQAMPTNRRLVMGLCHGTIDSDAMRTAAEIAQLLDLSLHYLFIEDEAVFALAELPFAREIQLATHSWSALTAEAVEADVRQASMECRRLMNEIIRDIGVQSAFEVLRGDPAACIVAACQAGDIIAVSEGAASAQPVTHSLTRLHAGAREVAASILLMPPRVRTRTGAVVALLTDDKDPALSLACRLAITANEALVILLPEKSATTKGTEARRAAMTRAEAMGLPSARISCQTVAGPGMDDILHALLDTQERLIVMTRASPVATAASRLAAARRVPVLLIGSDPSIVPAQAQSQL